MRIALLVILASCKLDYAEDCDGIDIKPGSHHECAMPGWFDRAFNLDVPESWDGSSPLPVILSFHGGGGSRRGQNKTTCPGGDTDDPGCIVAMANARGYAVVAPDGTGGRPLRNVRTWNAGGGHALQCVSGGACKSKVDDERYLDELYDEIGRAIPIDPKRVYATGISNGGAISHRLACMRPDRIAAIAPVGGANEWADDGDPCDARVPVRQIHGSKDPCWSFEGGENACIQDDGTKKTPVPTTMLNWASRNGCSTAPPIDTPRAKRDANDPTDLVIRTWTGCVAATELYLVEGGGHTWPNGWQYLGEDTVGRVSHEVDNADILDFFDAHRLP